MFLQFIRLQKYDKQNMVGLPEYTRIPKDKVRVCFQLQVRTSAALNARIVVTLDLEGLEV